MQMLRKTGDYGGDIEKLDNASQTVSLLWGILVNSMQRKKKFSINSNPDRISKES